MTTGDAQDFGDLATAKGGARGCSNATRAVHKGDGNSMEFITIATLGNATDFGDLSTQEQGDANTCSSSVRGVFPGRSDPAGGSYAKNNIEVFTGNECLIIKRLQKDNSKVVSSEDFINSVDLQGKKFE